MRLQEAISKDTFLWAVIYLHVKSTNEEITQVCGSHVRISKVKRLPSEMKLNVCKKENYYGRYRVGLAERSLKMLKDNIVGRAQLDKDVSTEYAKCKTDMCRIRKQKFISNIWISNIKKFMYTVLTLILKEIMKIIFLEVEGKNSWIFSHTRSGCYRTSCCKNQTCIDGKYCFGNPTKIFSTYMLSISSF